MKKVKVRLNKRAMLHKVAAAPDKELVSGQYQYWITSYGALARGRITQLDPIILLDYNTVEVLF